MTFKLYLQCEAFYINFSIKTMHSMRVSLLHKLYSSRFIFEAVAVSTPMVM